MRLQCISKYMYFFQFLEFLGFLVIYFFCMNGQEINVKDGFILYFIIMNYGSKCQFVVNFENCGEGINCLSVKKFNWQ